MLARDMDAALAIINAAARAYRGVIPADRWHDPYMPRDELEAEIANGILFRVVEEDGLLSAYDHAELTSSAAATFVWTYLCGQMAKPAASEH